MKEMDILEMIGEARSDFVLDAYRLMTGSVQKTKVPARKVWLVAAMIVLSLLLVGCTVAYVQGWFADYFSVQGEEPLSDSQISYLNENEQVLNQVQSRNGWTIELRSAITDGTKGIVILGVTAPGEVSLERVYNENGYVISQLELGNGNMPQVLLDGTPYNAGWSWRDDGDGLANTEYFVLEVRLDPENNTRKPFHKSAQWTVTLDSILRSTDDVELLKEISNGRGEYLYFGEVSAKEVLVEGPWEFTFRFRAETAEEASREILTGPVVTAAQVYQRYGEGVGEYSYFLQDITLTSVKVNPLTVTLDYEEADLNPWFGWEAPRPVVVLKDGREIVLENGHPEEGTTVLNAKMPIVLDEADHVRLADGTKLYMDGRTEQPAWRGKVPEAAPESIHYGVTTMAEAAAYYKTAQAGSAVYGYPADFDRDGVEDLAIWYDGRVHVLCLMDHNGTVKEELFFEEGMVLYEKYNMWAQASEQMPNLLMLGETDYVEEWMRLLQVRDGALHLVEGFRLEQEQYALLEHQEGIYHPEQEIWTEVSREDYEKVRKNFSKMNCTLIPIEWCGIM